MNQPSAESLTPSELWISFEVTEASILNHARWLRERRDLPQPVYFYFDQAGHLVRHSWYQYSFASIAFFHAILGFERALRITYNAGLEDNFSELSKRAVDDGFLTDSSFQMHTPLREEFLERIEKSSGSYAQDLSRLIPKLRNEYFHGDYLLAPDFLPLCLRLREACDVLATRGKTNNATQADK